MFVSNTSVLAGTQDLLEPETAVWRFAPLAVRSYDVLVIDPPWPFKTRSPKGQVKSGSMHYRSLTLAEIKELPVKDDVVYLWTTGPLLDDAIGYNTPVPQITLINKRDTPALISKRSFLDGDGKLESDGSGCRMSTGKAARELNEQRPRLSLREISAALASEGFRMSRGLPCILPDPEDYA
jgi:MT-A70